ncbi:MAG TPA: nucleotidyl transferase AbiEii/AbiGii toxin family protein [Solirubrobacterales bacterium]|nr:nucleotidyl transferase AbiEii/AbiGii toxin family protein [Solirubrobacterales bacterium]
MAPHLPEQLYLGGGTAVMVHMRHRKSRDLDFFAHEDVDLDRLKEKLEDLGPFATTFEEEGTLKGLFGATKLEVFVNPLLKQLAPPQPVAGLRIASLQDLMAMKIKVLAERGEARDYFDVKTIDESGHIPVEEGIELYLDRYPIESTSAVLQHLYRALGDLSDVEEDAALPMTTKELQEWWGRRQAQVLRNSSRFS